MMPITFTRTERFLFIPHSGLAKGGLSKLDQFAEYIAEGYSKGEAAHIVYGDSTYGNPMFQRLRKRAGAQAK